MIENDAGDRLGIAREVNSKRSRSGKTLTPQHINSTDELIEQYREYAKRDLAMRYGPAETPEQQRGIDMACEFYADLAAKQLKHDMPALCYFFRRYLSQH